MSDESAVRADVRRWRANRQDEVDCAALYRAVAAAESQPQLAELYRRLAATEEQHADVWERRLRAAGDKPPPSRPGWRARVMARLARRFGPQFILRRWRSSSPDGSSILAT